jgi:hypothetical protein
MTLSVPKAYKKRSLVLIQSRPDDFKRFEKRLPIADTPLAKNANQEITNPGSQST